MRNKVEAISKIKLQTSKRHAPISESKRSDIVQGILDANISDSFVVESDMPQEILGIKIDWSRNAVDKGGKLG